MSLSGSKRGSVEIGDSPKKTKKIKSITASTPDSRPPPLTWAPEGFNANRGRLLTKDHDVSPSENSGKSCVVLWMSRDQRAVDNHAIVYAQGLAQAQGVPLKVCINKS